MERRFYKLERTGVLEAVLKLVQLARRRDMRVLIGVAGLDEARALDKALWNVDGFLAHSRAQNDDTAVYAPIIIVAPEDDYQGEADCHIIIGMAGSQPRDTASLACYVFAAADEPCVTRNRGLWKAWSGEGHHLTYWSEQANSGWKKDAEVNATTS